MKFRKPLFIIEASGKIQMFKSILNQIGINNAHVEATNGRLFDLPEKEHGLDPVTFSIKKMSPINAKKIEYLQKHIDEASDIFIATDTDIEGEVIAKQVTNYCKSHPKVFRIQLTKLSPSTMTEAINSKGILSNEKVVAGYARRNFDRLVGYGCSTSDWVSEGFQVKGVVGRIITPIIKALNDEDYEIAKLQYQDKYLQGGTIDISIPKSKANMLTNILSEFKNLQSPNVVFQEELIYDNDEYVGPAPDFLCGVSESLGISVVDAAECLQDLYEEGSVSYPRTDSFYLSKETVADMSKLAENFGVKGFDKDFFLEKAKSLAKLNPSQEAHESLHPITSRLSPFTGIDGLTMKEQVLLILIRETFRSGQSNRKTLRSLGSFSSSNDNNKWNSFLSRYSLNASITKCMTYTNEYDKNEINLSFGRYGLLRNQKDTNRVYVKPKDIIVLQLMLSKGLGRPSTLPFHADKIARRFLSDDYSLTSLALNSLQKAALTSKGLLVSNNAIKIEQILHDTLSGKSVSEKINECIDIAGIDRKDIERTLNKDSLNKSVIIDEDLYNY